MQRFNVSREILVPFGDLIGDDNPIHRNAGVAQALGLRDTPVYGVLLQALAERVAVDFVHERDFQVVPVAQAFSFRKPAYPESELEYRTEVFSENESGVKVNVDAYTNGDIVLSSRASFAPRREIFGELPKVESMGRYALNAEKHRLFNSFLHKAGASASNGSVPFMLPAAFFSAELLRLGKEHGEVRGVYRSAEFQFYGRAEEDTDLTVGVQVAAQKKNFYKFNGVCYQGRNPIVAGSLTLIAPHSSPVST